MFTYKRCTKGLLGSNTYILWDEATKACALIDAGNPPEIIAPVLAANQLDVHYILLTHAHYDHIFYLEDYLRLAPNAQVAVHTLDNELLPNPRLNASSIFGPEKRFPQGDLWLKQGDHLPLGQGELRIYHTPGHTPGGICIQADQFLFTGDTLFYDGFGRTDLGAGDTKAMAASIEWLYTFDPDLTVLPGHGIATTIGREARENPYMDF